MAFTKVSVHWGKLSNQTFWVLLDIGSELTQETQNVTVVHQSKGLWRSHDEWRFSSGPVGTKTHPLVISPVLECIIGRDLLNNWRNSHIDYLTYGIRATVMGKTK